MWVFLAFPTLPIPLWGPTSSITPHLKTVRDIDVGVLMCSCVLHKFIVIAHIHPECVPIFVDFVDVRSDPLQIGGIDMDSNPVTSS